MCLCYLSKVKTGLNLARVAYSALAKRQFCSQTVELPGRYRGTVLTTDYKTLSTPDVEQSMFCSSPSSYDQKKICLKQKTSDLSRYFTENLASMSIAIVSIYMNCFILAHILF